MPRYWTVAAARAALPSVIALLEQARDLLRAEAEARGRGSQPARSAARLASQPVNGHGAARPDDNLARAGQLLARITKLGVQVKDVEAGLIDFPHLRGAEEVLLCYRLGEAELTYWHDLDRGFAGRRPLSEL